MAQIYDHQSEELHALLTNAANNQGATLVIPDLQRPYVWTPGQVSLLVDSLIRGWPFGTLLLWKVEDGEKRNIPSRAFWKIVDRTDDDSGHALLEGQPPATYQMVLDGQQRVQSLLLATHGDSWGFKLPDKDWGVEVGSKSAKGKTNKKHWSLGSLCLDLTKFLECYNAADKQISAVEFDKALAWAVNDEANGKSKAKTSPHYKRPIADRFVDENKSNMIRFSRLWDVAGANRNWKEKNYSDQIAQLLTHHGIPAEQHSQFQKPLEELMTTLRDVKLQKVAFLELRAFDKSTMDRDAYDDAIVNIFTRLNTAGRTLSREEITFAWLKVGWLPDKTSNRSAQKCFKDLQAELNSQGLELDIDGLVSSVSFIWAVIHNGGKVLTNRDLLQGDIIRPMGATLSGDWDLLAATISNVARIVKERGLIDGKVFGSINALAVFWAVAYQFTRRGNALVVEYLERDSMQREADRLICLYLDRWLAASTWAQRWAISSAKVLPNYAQELASDEPSYAAATTIAAAATVHQRQLSALIDGVRADAEEHITNRLGVEDRGQVSQYFGPLWLWHRLDSQRWNSSKQQLQIGKAKAEIDVDHVVSVKIWNNRDIPDGVIPEEESHDSVINSLGNCVLLQKSFNIIKSADPLRTFINKVHGFKGSPENVEPWANKLGITKNLLDGNSSDIRQMVNDVKARDAGIRADLIKFLRGETTRVDPLGAD